MTRAGQPWVAALVVGLYAAAWRAYGVFDLADEGTLLMQAWRVAHGQQLHADFDSGFGALYFALQSRLVTLGGLAAVRWALVATQAASAGLVFVLARRLAGTAGAWVAVAVLVAFFLPVSPGQGAPFLMPYPAWYVSVLFLLAAVVLGDPRRVSTGRAFAIGALAGVAFALKPNGGLLLAAAAATALAVGRGGTRPVAIVSLLAGAMVVALFGARVLPLGFALLGVLLGLALQAERRVVPSVVPLVALVAGGIAVGGALQLAPLMALGPQRYASEVLLIGAGVADVFRAPYPLGAVVGVTAGALACVVPSRGGAVAVGALGLTVVAAVSLAGGPGGVAGVRLAAEALAFCGVMLAVAAGMRAVRRGAYGLIAPVAWAAFIVAQLHPRPDFVHLLEVGPVVLPLAAWAWRRVVIAVVLPRRARTAVAVGLPLLVCAGRVATLVPVMSAVVRGDAEVVTAGASTLVSTSPVVMRGLSSVVAAVQARTAPADEVLAFPACALVPFLADRAPAGPFDYFFPGRPTRDEVAALVERLTAKPPRVAVTCTASGTDLAGAWHVYPEMAAFLAGRYRPVLDAPPFTLLEVRP